MSKQTAQFAVNVTHLNNVVIGRIHREPAGPWVFWEIEGDQKTERESLEELVAELLERFEIGMGCDIVMRPYLERG